MIIFKVFTVKSEYQKCPLPFMLPLSPAVWHSACRLLLKLGSASGFPEPRLCYHEKWMRVTSKFKTGMLNAKFGNSWEFGGEPLNCIAFGEAGTTLSVWLKPISPTPARCLCSAEQESSSLLIKIQALIWVEGELEQFTYFLSTLYLVSVLHFCFIYSHGVCSEVMQVGGSCGIPDVHFVCKYFQVTTGFFIAS